MDSSNSVIFTAFKFISRELYPTPPPLWALPFPTWIDTEKTWELTSWQIQDVDHYKHWPEVNIFKTTGEKCDGVLQVYCQNQNGLIDDRSLYDLRPHQRKRVINVAWMIVFLNQNVGQLDVIHLDI